MSMSYCCIENAYLVLKEASEKIMDTPDKFLSESELHHRKLLLKLCKAIVESDQ